MDERTVVTQVWKLAEPLVLHEGMEVVDIEYRRERGGLVLRLFLDREGGIDLDHLTRVSRQLSDLLDVHDVVPGSYTLEVSSPGINRRLRKPEHFRRYVGKRVRIRTHEPRDGRRVYVGRLETVDDTGVHVFDGHATHFVAFADIAQANYEHDFTAERAPGSRGRKVSR